MSDKHNNDAKVVYYGAFDKLLLDLYFMINILLCIKCKGKIFQSV